MTRRRRFYARFGNEDAKIKGIISSRIRNALVFWVPSNILTWTWHRYGKSTVEKHVYTVPSGKRLHNYGKSSFLIGKSTISMAIFYSFLYVYQRVDHFLTGKSWISIATVCLLRPGMEGMDFSRTFQRMWGVIYSQRQCLKNWFREETPQHDFWIHGFDAAPSECLVLCWVCNGLNRSGSDYGTSARAEGKTQTHHTPCGDGWYQKLCKHGLPHSNIYPFQDVKIAT